MTNLENMTIRKKKKNVEIDKQFTDRVQFLLFKLFLSGEVPK